MKKNSFYIRHGITDALRQEIFCGGDSDIPMNEEGHHETHLLASTLSSSLSEVDVIYCSPLTRAKQTAEIFQKVLKKEIVVMEGLREWRLGEWEGVQWSKLPPLFENENIPPPGGETRLEFRNRVQDTMNILLNDEKSFLVIGHAVFFYELYQYFTGNQRILSHAEMAWLNYTNNMKLNLKIIHKDSRVWPNLNP